MQSRIMQRSGIQSSSIQRDGVDRRRVMAGEAKEVVCRRRQHQFLAGQI